MIQKTDTGEVLMVGYMNRAALEKTRSELRVWFFSRSRQRLWRMGETSGNTLTVKGVYTDCDRDALLVRVAPAGPVCHTGKASCFYRELEVKR